MLRIWLPKTGAILTVHSQKTKELKKADGWDLLSHKAIICSWSGRVDQSPSHILICDGVLNCTCLPLSKGRAVLCGTDEGVLHVWDLWKVNGDWLHTDLKRVISDEYNLVLQNRMRRACFPTNEKTIVRGNSFHKSAIVGVSAFPGRGFDNGTCEVGSIDETGVIVLW